jgi:hypothetical protein
MPMLDSESITSSFACFAFCLIELDLLDACDSIDLNVEELFFMRNDEVFRGGIGSLFIMPSSRGVKSKCEASIRIKSFWLYGIQILIHRVCSSVGRGELSNVLYACASRSKAQ